MIRALEACRFAGKNYTAGEVVPASSIPQKMIGALVDMQVIEVAEEPKPTEILKPAEDPKPAEILKPAEEPKPAEILKPTEEPKPKPKARKR